jgi:predicted phage baseplate assembly protein
VKLFAPGAFRKSLRRAVIADDYARLVERDFEQEVQLAGASLRWTGSWYEAEVAIDARGTEDADASLLERISRRLHRYRRMGHDLKVTPARYVPVDIELAVCVRPHYLRGHVEAALLDVFSNRSLPDGRFGLFHPDNLTFGQGIFVSKLVAAAQGVAGVESVRVVALHRHGEDGHGELDDGILRLGPLEVAQLDSDPSFPEHGRVKLIIGGGR